MTVGMDAIRGIRRTIFFAILVFFFFFLFSVLKIYFGETKEKKGLKILSSELVMGDGRGKDGFGYSVSLYYGLLCIT